MGLKDLVIDGLTAIRQRLPSFDGPRDSSDRDNQRDESPKKEEPGETAVDRIAGAPSIVTTVGLPSKVKRSVPKSSAEDSGNRDENHASGLTVPKGANRDASKPMSLVGGDAKKAKKQNKNELTHLIPGYTAPISLSSSSLDKYRPAGGLEAIRQQSLSADHPTPSTSIDTRKTGTRKRKDRSHAGDGWFQMRPTPLTDEVKKDLQFIRNRNYLDPKRFYKSSDPTGEFVQVGTVIEGPSEYFSSRLTKKERRTNLVDEVLADRSASEYAQNKFKEMQRQKTALAQKRKRWGGKKRR